MKKIWILPALALLGVGLWRQPYPLLPEGPCPFDALEAEPSPREGEAFIVGQLSFPPGWPTPPSWPTLGEELATLPNIVASGAPWPDGSTERSVQVATNGSFRIPAAPGTRMARLWLDSDWLDAYPITWFAWQSETLRPQARWEKKPQVQATGESFRLHGQLSSMLGLPLENPWVDCGHIVVDGNTVPRPRVPVIDGRFDFYVQAPLPDSLNAGAEGHAISYLKLDPDSLGPFDVVLAAPEPFQGRVVDTQGKPLIGAKVCVLSPVTDNDPGLGMTGETHTDQEGHFVLLGYEDYSTIALAVHLPVQGASWPRIQHYGEVALWQDPSTLVFDPESHSVSIQVSDAEGHAVPAFEVRLEPSQFQSETLVDPYTQLICGTGDSFGSPPQEARIEEMGQPLPLPGTLRMQVTDQDGPSEIGPIPRGYWRLQVFAPGFAPYTKDTLRSPRKYPVEVGLQPSSNLLVTVLDDSGETLPGVTVYLRQEETTLKTQSITTDAIGRARFLDLAPDSYKFFSISEFIDSQGEDLVRLQPGDRVEKTLRMESLGALHGKLEFKGPEFDARVTLEEWKSGSPAYTTLVSDGEFYFDAVATGPYRMRVTSSTIHQADPGFVEPQKVRIFKHRTAHVLLKTSSGYGVVAGTVSINGQPVLEAERRFNIGSLQLMGEQALPNTPAANPWASLQHGVLRPMALEPGTYALTYGGGSNGYGEGSFMVLAGQSQHLDIALKAPSLELSFEDAEGLPITIPASMASRFRLHAEAGFPSLGAIAKEPQDGSVSWPTIAPGVYDLALSRSTAESPWALMGKETITIPPDLAPVRKTLQLEPRYPLRVQLHLNDFPRGQTLHLQADGDAEGTQYLQVAACPTAPQQTVTLHGLRAHNIWIFADMLERRTPSHGPFVVTPDGQASIELHFDWKDMQRRPALSGPVPPAAESE